MFHDDRSVFLTTEIMGLLLVNPAALAKISQDTSWDTVLQQTTDGEKKRVAQPPAADEEQVPRKKPCNNNNTHKHARAEKNAREKQRSLSIATQISEIGKLVTAAAAADNNNTIVSLHRGTKSEVLSEAVKYIRLLQERLQHLDMERTKLLQVVQEIGAGSNSSAATAVRTAVAQQGIWSLSGFEGAPPKTEGSIYYSNGGCVVSDGSSSTSSSSSTNTVKEAIAGGINYQLVFQACPVGMVRDDNDVYVCCDLHCMLASIDLTFTFLLPSNIGNCLFRRTVCGLQSRIL